MFYFVTERTFEKILFLAGQEDLKRRLSILLKYFVHRQRTSFVQYSSGAPQESVFVAFY